MQCDDGYRIGIKETTVFSPGVERFPAFDVSDVKVDVKVEDGQMVATIGGTDDDPDGRTPDTELHVGESVVNKKAGRFTLLGIKPAAGEAIYGGGGIAHFCYVPAPGFEIDSEFFTGPPGED